MGEPLKLKSIKNVIEMGDFFIPFYQRGYRWGKMQVEKLLDDILEFSYNKSKDKFYPLQPIVVFKDIDKYELIDGQQRLTTIYIILKYLKNTFNEIESKKEELEELQDIIGSCFGNIADLNNKIKALPSITYETRDKNKEFFDAISEKINSDNPDFYHMSNAYKTIKEWFLNNNINFELFLNSLLNDVKVIWYEIEESNEKEKRDIFARLNIGKIELTNAELIRALLLNDIKEYKQQIEIGYELDKIEYSLRDELFWYFLEDKDTDTKIDLIYELLADTYKDELEDNEKNKFDKNLDVKYSFYIFEYFLNSAQNKKTKNTILKDVKQYFRFLEEWFIDKEFYHKIGYLLTIQKHVILLDFIKKYKESNKRDFREYLDNEIKQNLKNIDVCELKYGPNSADIRKVLLLFNIQTILDNENITYKFDFRNFKNRKNNDDIEHIRSQTTPDIEGKKRKEWIETVLKYYYGYKKANNDKNINKLSEEKLFEKFYKKISEKLEEQRKFNEDLKDNIGNLTLLDSGINRSYGNSFFPIKRAIILEEDREGTFLPPCTKNVFLKTYSNKIDTMMEWDENDIKSHQEAIITTISKYFGENNEQCFK